MTNVVTRVARHSGAAGAIALLAGLGPHGLALTVMSVAYLVAYFVRVAGLCILGVLQWAKTFTGELLELLSLAGGVPSAVRECRSKWRGTLRLAGSFTPRTALGENVDCKTGLLNDDADGHVAVVTAASPLAGTHQG